MSALAGSPRAYAQSGCSPTEYAKFVAGAQALNNAVEPAGRRLLTCDASNYREGALYWLNFLATMNHSPNTPEIYARIFSPGRPSGDEKVWLEREALKGRYQPLEQKVRGGALGYPDDPTVLQALARSQMIAHHYDEGIKTYNDLVRLREDQDAAEIELLYAYIWAGDKVGAQTKIAALNRFNKGDYTRQSIARAEPFLKDEEKHPEHHDELSLAFLDHSDNRGYNTTGGVVVYKGAAEVEIEALQDKTPQEKEKTQALSIGVGKVWGDEEKRFFEGRIGYFDADSDHITGRLGAGTNFGEHVHLAGHVERREVSAYERPPAGERAGLMRDSVGYDLNLYDRFSLSSQAFTEESKAVTEDYVVEYKIGPLLKENESGFGLYIPAAYRKRPEPSPDYQSFPNDARLGLGVRLALSDGYTYDLRAAIDVDSIYRDDYGRVGRYENTVGARFALNGRYYFIRKFYSYFEASGYAIGKRTGEQDEERGSKVIAGFGFVQ